MVKRLGGLDSVFMSLAHPTRRDILKRVAGRELSITEIAVPYRLSFAAISKHLKVLEGAGLINKRRQGKSYFVKLAPEALSEAGDFLEKYKRLWHARLDSFERYLKTI